MNKRSETVREFQPGHGRDAALNAAILRIGNSPDLDNMLEEVVSSARALTGAHYGVITTVDGSGEPRDFVASGVTPEQRRSMAEWSDAIRLFGQLRDLDTPLRVPDLDAWIRTLGCSSFPIPCKSFQATPLRHLGMAVGGFFLGRTNGEFTKSDEDLLVRFAEQAAGAIADARARSEERRAKTDLEALVETCPVGVAVLDARTGTPLSLNREAGRILAELDLADSSVEHLREAVVCRRGDGQEITLADLGGVETVRAEEVEISVAGGASVRTLIDATPILSPGGGVERVVVTLQDLEPFEALVRARAEFLGLVSHELRAPLAAIKGSAATALADAREPDRAELRQYLRIIEDHADHMGRLISDLLDAGRIGAGMIDVNPAPESLASLIERARTVFSGGGGRHPIIVELPAGLPRIMADRRRLLQVLNTLIANAARQSPETAQIRVTAKSDETHVAVSVADAGESMAPERLSQLFRQHAIGNEIDGGGLGLGLVICKGLVEAHGGRIRAGSTETGQGTCITFTMPAVAEDDRSPSTVVGESRKRQDKTPVLVVDHDPHALHQARDALASAGYAPVVTPDPEKLAHLVETKRPALVLLDLALPETDGIELMLTHPALINLPVIFVSANGRGDTIAKALEAGAADYIVKPLSSAELVARVGLAIRRRAASDSFVLGDLAIDRVKRRVTLAGRTVRLTAIEYRLLHALSMDAGGVTTYDSLMRRVWGRSDRSNLQAVRSAVRKLRRKLGDEKTQPRYIFNVRGLGYQMPGPGDR